MHPFLNIANRAARSAGDLIARSVERLDLLQCTEKQKNDFVTNIDKESEKIIIETIRKTYPNHAIISEEAGKLEGNEITWIIDPLDGTTNFMHGFPHFAISIGVQVKDRIDQALIFDPIRHETFTASRGEGAQLNNRRIRVSSRTSLQGSLLGTGFPYREITRLDEYMKVLHSLMPLSAGIRRAGAAVLDLAYIAAGRLDGFWEFGLSIWDVAAGSLLIQEAGGLVSDDHGGENYLTTGNIVAGNPKVFKALLQMMK